MDQDAGISMDKMAMELPESMEGIVLAGRGPAALG